MISTLRTNNPLPKFLMIAIGFLVVVTVALHMRRTNTSREPTAPTPSSAPNLILDERLTRRLSHLSPQEQEEWKEQANPLARYRFTYPAELAVRDNGILGATLYPVAALPKIDGKISTNIPLPTNYGYFNVLPTAENGGVRSISPEFDREWDLLIGLRTASSAADRQKLKPFLDARTEVEELSKLQVGESNGLFERLENTQLNTFNAQTYRSVRPLSGFPKGVTELRHLYETPTMTYIFGWYTGGKKEDDPTALSPELLQKIFNTILIQ